MMRQRKITKKNEIITLLKEATSTYTKTLQDQVFTPLSEHKMKKLQQTIKSFIPDP